VSEGAEKGGSTGVFMRLPPELVSGWKALAERRGMSMAALQELVMRQVLQGEDAPVGLPDRAANAKKQSLTLRLRPDEIEAIRKAAEQDGHSLSGWMAMLVRARLRQAPSFSADEIAALLKASTQLMAVGRNINTAVRRLNTEGVWSSQIQTMKAVAATVKLIEDRVNALQATAERRSNF